MRRPFKNPTLKSGDRLEKVGTPGSVWVVKHLINPLHQLPHAVILYDKNHRETRMLALSVLCDESRYRRLEDRSRKAADD